MYSQISTQNIYIIKIKQTYYLTLFLLAMWSEYNYNSKPAINYSNKNRWLRTELSYNHTYSQTQSNIYFN